MKTSKSTAILSLAMVWAGVVPSLHAQSNSAAAPQLLAIEVRMVGAGKIPLPAEFQIALYEDLIQEFQKKGVFRRVYRDGDRNAANAPDVVSLYTTVKNFKQGSELERDVTTVGGATSITVHCQLKAKSGTVLLERDIQGKVRLIGDDLKATDNFAKKAAEITPERLDASTVPSDASEPEGIM